MKFKTFLSLIRYGGINNLFKNMKNYNSILESNLFDEVFYQNNYDCEGMDPLVHYMFKGVREHNTPSFEFDSFQYLKNNPDAVDTNPILHSLSNGKNSYKVDKYEWLDEIKTRNLDNLTNFDFSEEPLVSIIILNKNGLNHLKRLFKDFKENTNYNNYEIIVVDNNSTDDSVNYLKSLDLPIKVIENSKNKSFSEANNDGVKESNGELILLMNNDIETTYGWLNELVGTLLNNENVGGVGPKLIYPYFLDNREESYTIQSAGDSFFDALDCYKPDNAYKGINLWDSSVNELIDVVGITGAVFLTTREIYEKLNGLDETYYYCYEDVDFCLKLNEAGYRILYCPNSLVIHYESPTRKLDNNLRENIKINRETLNEKWGDYLFKHILENRLDNNLFYTLDKLKIAIIDNSKMDIDNIVNSLNDEYEVNIFDLDKFKFDLDADIIISFNPEYDPLKVESKINTLKIAWILDNHNEWEDQLDFYDIIIDSKDNSLDEFKKNVKENVGIT